MRFERNLDVWRMTLTAPGLQLREYTFADSSKVEDMAKRGGAMRILADVQAVEFAIRSGRGGIQLALNDAQLKAVQSK